MPHTTYAEVAAAAETLLSGLKANSGQMSKRGIDEQFLSEFEKNKNSFISLNNEQETLKAKLKEKTGQLEDMGNILKKQISEARKMIKVEIPQKLWKEYGITDKR